MALENSCYTSLIILVVLVASGFNAHAAYKIISSTKVGDKHLEFSGIVQKITTSKDVVWQTLPLKPWFPGLMLTEGEIVVEDVQLPKMDAAINMEAKDAIKLSKRNLSVRNFTITGKLDAADAALICMEQLNKAGIKSVIIEGSGTFAVDEKNGAPIFGKFHIVRRLKPELWQENENLKQMEGDIAIAWVEIP